MTPRKALRISSVLAVLAATASPANADIGVPMLAAVWPMMWISFVPIVLIEAAIAKRVVGLNWRGSMTLALKANAVSTLAGVPITWVALVLFQLVTGGGTAYGLGTPLKRALAVTWQSPWLIPYEPELKWMVPIAAMVLCVPFYFMSVWCENLVARKPFEPEQRPAVLRWAWMANAASYGLLLLWPLYFLVFPPT